MFEHFDAYHQWLGISPKDQPPNHYRLLGIDLFEADSNVIANAADQRMIHVRSFQTGKNSDLSQKILNEISAAKVCLLNAAKKPAYDEDLRRKMKASLPVAPPMVAPPIKVTPAQQAIPDAFDFDPAPTFHAKHANKQFPFALAAVVVASVVLVWLVAMSISGGNGTPEPKGEVASKPIDAFDPPPPKPKPQPVRRTPTPKPQPKVDPNPEPQPEAAKPEPPKPAPPKSKVDPSLEPESKLEPQAEPQQEPEAEAKEKLPVPDAIAQHKSLAIIRDIYKDEDRAALATKLIEKARETQDATDHFVLLREAKDVASETWQGELAFEVIDTMADEYDISAPEMKAEVLEQAAKRPRIMPEQKAAIANAALKVIDEAVGGDNFDTAKKLGRLASQLVRQTKDKDLLQEIVAKNKEVDAAAKMYADAQGAMAILKEKPDDPDANLTMGKYLCFTKGDWDTGLPMLANGSDAELKTLAEKECEGAVSSSEQANLGDAWWDLGETQEEMAKRQIRGRASRWYRQALPGLSGLPKDKVEKRLAKAKPATTTGDDPTKRPKPGSFGRLFISCDDAFELYVNGEKILAGDLKSVATRDWRFSSGDVIVVKCVNTGGPKGFACQIRFKANGISTARGWMGYKLKSDREWYKPQNVGELYAVVPGSNHDTTKNVKQACGFSPPDVWGQTDICYLVYVVRL